jgi:hypothetical protein
MLEGAVMSKPRSSREISADSGLHSENPMDESHVARYCFLPLTTLPRKLLELAFRDPVITNVPLEGFSGTDFCQTLPLGLGPRIPSSKS